MRRFLLTLAPIALVAIIPAYAAPVIASDDIEATIDTIERMRDAGIGYGAIVQIEALADAYGMDADELLTATPIVDRDWDFQFGSLKSDLTAEERVLLRRQVRNLKQLARDARAAARAGDDDGSHDGQSGDEESNDDESGEDRGDGAERLLKAELLSEALGLAADDVLELRDGGLSWGRIFHYATLAAATGTSIAELVAGPDSIGELRSGLTDEQREVLESAPRNFGHVRSGKFFDRFGTDDGSDDDDPRGGKRGADLRRHHDDESGADESSNEDSDDSSSG